MRIKQSLVDCCEYELSEEKYNEKKHASKKLYEKKKLYLLRRKFQNARKVRRKKTTLKLESDRCFSSPTLHRLYIKILVPFIVFGPFIVRMFLILTLQPQFVMFVFKFQLLVFFRRVFHGYIIFVYTSDIFTISNIEFFQNFWSQCAPTKNLQDSRQGDRR